MRYITFMFITLILSACSSRPCRNIEGQQQICSDTHRVEDSFSLRHTLVGEVHRGGNGHHRVGNG